MVIRACTWLLILVLPAVLAAQGPPGGGFGGGFGGPPGGFGGPPGGFMGGFNPADMVRRMDTNGNGMLDPEEAQGRARFFLDRMAQNNPQLNFSRPVPLDQITREFDRMREQRSREGGGFGPPGSTPEGSPAPGSTPAGAKPADTRLVPGFDVAVNLSPPPGFGSSAPATVASSGAAAAPAITDADRKEAEDRIQRYDGNRDGVLDQNELSQGRWSDDPMRFDRNKDGRLTRDELAVRYAERRTERERQASGGTGAPGSSGGSSRMDGFVNSMFEQYDRNKSGVFERDEWSSFRRDPSAADTNGDGRITREEISAWMASRFGGGPGGGPPGGGFGGPPGGGFGGPPGGGFGPPGGGFGGPPGGFGGPPGGFGGPSPTPPSGSSASPSSSAPPTDSRKSYRQRSVAERLPKGLPEWFARNDTSADGQVTMAEFSAAWNDSVVSDFNKFDLNKDGLITANECIKAISGGAIRGSTTTTSVATTSSSSPTSPTTSPTTLASTSPSNPAPSTTPAVATSSVPASTPAGSAPPIDEKYRKYFQGLLQKYDTNGDAVLTGDEWSKMSKDPSASDANKDGRITLEELAAWSLKK